MIIMIIKIIYSVLSHRVQYTVQRVKDNRNASTRVKETYT